LTCSVERDRDRQAVQGVIVGGWVVDCRVGNGCEVVGYRAQMLNDCMLVLAAVVELTYIPAMEWTWPESSAFL
jgi:hypothetical protein